MPINSTGDLRTKRKPTDRLSRRLSVASTTGMGFGPLAQAQFVLAHPLALMRIPDGVSFAQAAAFPAVFITAHGTEGLRSVVLESAQILQKPVDGDAIIHAIEQVSRRRLRSAR